MIYWFSGTGNSRRVAQDMAQLLGEKLAMMTPGLTTADKRVVWVFPIYSWGVPPYVRQVIESASCPVGSHHFMVATCGDDAGNAARMWRRIIGSRGWDAVGVYTVIMPNNYVSMKGFDVDSEELARAKLAAEPDRVREVASGIESELRTDDVVRGRFPWLKTSVIYPWFIRNAMSPKPFNVDDNCISCGNCMGACPLENVMLVNGRPVWGDNCAGCLGCYHACPRHAINYGKATQNKGQYYLDYMD